MNAASGPNQIERALARRLPTSLRSEDGFAVWFEPINQRAQVAAQTVREAVSSVLTAHAKRVETAEGHHRRIFDLYDGGSMTKSVHSIRSKIGRELVSPDSAHAGQGRLSEGDVKKIVLRFPDLGRFRVVCGLSSDVLGALDVLLGKDRRLLCDRFRLASPLKDYVHDLRRRDPARGHRAWQLAVAGPAGDPREPVRVEVQIMTMVQHVWDQRNHPVYEWTREGGRLPDHLVIRDVALAETLYLVDEQASRNWKDFLDWKRGEAAG